MKYTFCEKLMWFALAGTSFKYLESRGQSVSKKKAKEIFRQMAARTPDIGSLMENPLRSCLSGGMVWLSIYEAAEGNLEKAVFGEMVTTSMASPLSIASFKAKAKTAFTIQKQKNRADVAEKTNVLAQSNPFHWNAELILGRDADEYTLNYHQCGLCALGKQEGLFHLVPYMLCWILCPSTGWAAFCTERRPLPPAATSVISISAGRVLNGMYKRIAFMGSSIAPLCCLEATKQTR